MHGEFCPSLLALGNELDRFLCKRQLLCFCGGNEMGGWSLADDNEVKETNNVNPVGFSDINN